MKVHGLSDLHVDYAGNLDWLRSLSDLSYRDDILLLAGDISDDLALLETTFDSLANTFGAVFFVPGNHDLWVKRCGSDSSLVKHEHLRQLARNKGVLLEPKVIAGLKIVPMQSWYDYTFGMPDTLLQKSWMDFRACRWSEFESDVELTSHFLDQNDCTRDDTNMVISFSHFLPRIDVMPEYIPQKFRYLYPVLGTARLDTQIRALNSKLHLYGHSHVNRDVEIEGTRYVNNAFGYPSETRITRKELFTLYSDES